MSKELEEKYEAIAKQIKADILDKYEFHDSEFSGIIDNIRYSVKSQDIDGQKYVVEFEDIVDGSSITYENEKWDATIVIAEEEKRTHYRKKNVFNLPVALKKQIWVTKSENEEIDIDEYYYISEQYDEKIIPKKADKIVDDFVDNNPGYKAYEEVTIIREKIDKDEEVKDIIKPEEVLDEYLVPGSKTKYNAFPAGFYEDRHDYEFNKNIKKDKDFKIYEDYVQEANKKIEECKEIYSIIHNILIEKGILIEDDAKTEEIDSEVEEIENVENVESIESAQEEVTEEAEQQNIQENIEEDIEQVTEEKDVESIVDLLDEDINSISDEELDGIINDLEEKNQEEKQRIAKLNKKNTIIALIEENKKLDKEREELEEKIKEKENQKKGREINE